MLLIKDRHLDELQIDKVKTKTLKYRVHQKLVKAKLQESRQERRQSHNLTERTSSQATSKDLKRTLKPTRSQSGIKTLTPRRLIEAEKTNRARALTVVRAKTRYKTKTTRTQMQRLLIMLRFSIRKKSVKSTMDGACIRRHGYHSRR